MIINRETASYNERRYGKPWIAKVDFSGGAKGNFVFGDWAGDHRNGGAGVLEIDAMPGDIIAVGQKDNRNPKNSAPHFYLFSPEETLQSLGDKGAAYKHYQAVKTAVPDREALQREKETLLARLAEIDLAVIRAALDGEEGGLARHGRNGDDLSDCYKPLADTLSGTRQN